MLSDSFSGVPSCSVVFRLNGTLRLSAIMQSIEEYMCRYNTLQKWLCSNLQNLKRC